MEVTDAFYDKWNIYYTRSKNNLYKKYKKEAERRKLSFLLSELQWDALIRQPCYLCGYKQIEGIGLDRFDNSIREYNLQNCKPCCGSCNTMKHDMKYDDFLHHMKQIANKWEDTSELDRIPMFDNPFKKNTTCNKSNNKQKWTAKGLYYAILSNTDNEFLNLYMKYIKNDEYQRLKDKILLMTDKQEILTCISSYLNTLNVCRRRSKYSNP